MMGIHLQSSCIVSLVFTILWFFTESVFGLLRQDPSISKQAALYLKYQAPGLFAYGFLQNILRFCQTQSIVTPLVIFSFAPLVINIGTTYALVDLAGFGFIGAPIATSISLWIAFLSLGTYVMFSDKCKETWTGFSLESFRYVVLNLTLSIPSAAMVWQETIYCCNSLEYWVFEILVFLAGVMPNPETNTSLVAICVNTESICYMLTYGVSAVASTRVSNELGAGNVKGAKKATYVSVKLSLFLALGVVIAILVGHDGWVELYSDSLEIKDEFASLRFFLVASITLDLIPGVLSGVARGCGWQRLVTVINLGTFYLVGICLLWFQVKVLRQGFVVWSDMWNVLPILISFADDNFPEVDKAECCLCLKHIYFLKQYTRISKDLDALALLLKLGNLSDKQYTMQPLKNMYS